MCYVVACFVIEGLLMILEVDELDKHNCDERLKTTAMMSGGEIE